MQQFDSSLIRWPYFHVSPAKISRFPRPAVWMVQEKHLKPMQRSRCSPATETEMKTSVILTPRARHNDTVRHFTGNVAG